VRLFIAIMPPPAAVAELADRTAALRPAWPSLRWTSQEAWHITLAFLGEVPERVLAGLSAELERAARGHHAQEIAVRGGGAFPDARRARVVWAGVHADLDALGALAASVATGARRAGAPPSDEGEYRPHLTLAYARQATDVRPLTEELAYLAGSRWTASQIHLIRSHSGASGGGPSRYENLASWALRWPSGPLAP
jgi:RNA 2',3'-cyclic 3'-phosphodiesterase